MLTSLKKSYHNKISRSYRTVESYIDVFIVKHDRCSITGSKAFLHGLKNKSKNIIQSQYSESHLF